MNSLAATLCPGSSSDGESSQQKEKNLRELAPWHSLQQLFRALNQHAAALQFGQPVTFRHHNAARVAKFKPRGACGADAAAAAAAIVVVNAPAGQRALPACKRWSVKANVATTYNQNTTEIQPKYNRHRPEHAAALLQLPLPVSCAAAGREGTAVCDSEVWRVEGRNKAALAVSTRATPAQHARHLTCAPPPAGQQQQKQQQKQQQQQQEQQKQPEHCRRPIPSRKVPRNRGGWKLLRATGSKTNRLRVCFGGRVPMQSLAISCQPTLAPPRMNHSHRCTGTELQLQPWARKPKLA